MSDFTEILSQIESGDPKAAEQLLPLVYDELRKLAAAKLAHEKPGQTLRESGDGSQGAERRDQWSEVRGQLRAIRLPTSDLRRPTA